MEYKVVRDIYESQRPDIDTNAFNSKLSIQREWHIKKLNTLIDNVELKNKFVLDAGCGSGAISGEIAKKSKRLIGIDINPHAVKYAQSKKIHNANFVASNVEDIPFGDNSFDIITCFDVLDHCINPRKTLGEFYRVLNKNGLVFLIVQNHTIIWRFVESMWDRFGAGRDYGHVHVSRFTKRTMEIESKNSQFELKKIFSIHHLSPLIAIGKPWNYPKIIERTLGKSNFGFSVAVILGKKLRE